jgi:hypothetical protein
VFPVFDLGQPAVCNDTVRNLARWYFFYSALPPLASLGVEQNRKHVGVAILCENDSPPVAIDLEQGLLN